MKKTTALKNYKNLIFDFDGTLVDSKKAIYQATIKTLNNFGYQKISQNLTFEDYTKLSKRGSISSFF